MLRVAYRKAGTVCWKIPLAGTLSMSLAVFVGLGLMLGARQVQPDAVEALAASAAARCTSPPSISTEKETEIVMKKSLVAAGLMALAGAALAHDTPTMNEARELTPESITFKDDPAFPKGAQTVLLHGDPAKPGLFILRVKFPPNYVVPPHTHPGFETVTVLSGSMGSGMGEKADLTKGKMLKAGGMLALPANHAHYVWTADEETIIQVAAVGPFDLVYINPADDPRKK
jgi:quercetin dioxygenase-like cupin family protein